MIFFTADTHPGHRNILMLCNRPFATMEEMNETMISKWNDRVSDTDTVSIVGDMFFRRSDVETILKRLIVGNHDSSGINKVDFNRYFVSVDTLLEISDGKHALPLCHYPFLTWKHAQKSFMIHGHIYADTTADFFSLFCQRSSDLKARVDINGFVFATFDELIENNDTFKSKYLQGQRVPMYSRTH